MNPSRPFALLGVLLALLAGCDTTPPADTSAPGAMQLAVALPLAAPGDVARVTVTVSGADLASLSTDLTLTDGAWGGVLGDIPAGTGRTFLARAFSASNTLRYEGRADNVTVTAGTTGLVSLLLQDISPPPPLSNEAPLVDALVATPTSVTPGGTVSLSATAHDPNAGDTLSYTWSAPSGAFANTTQANTAWTAPSAEGPVTLSLTVQDSRGAALTVRLTIVVAVGRGAEEVKVGFNTAPRLVSQASSQSYLDVGQSTALTVSASDADGDALSYQWSATCAGTFTGATTASATFTPSTLPTAACNNCQLTVTVKDGRGGQNTGSVALCVTRDTTPRAPPAITRTYQSSATATASQPLTFELEASDPAGLALTFAWTATVGALGTPTTGATQSRITWTAPTCLTSGSTVSLTATVTNAAGQATSRNFPVTGPPACVVGWSSTGRMIDARSGHQATLLANGQVLVSAGRNATAELYDPATGTWSRTGSLFASRNKHTATLLPNGKVLVAGGRSDTEYLSTAEVYDPATGTWSRTGSLATARFWHTATLLPSGKVLVAGGYNITNDIVATAELYDPATGTWSPTGSMTMAREEHTATRLSSGKVLVAGGHTNTSSLVAELYDPATGTWSATGSMTAFRYQHEATPLANGKVLVLGAALASELYDPATGTWSGSSSMTTRRERLTSIRLATGKVLATGGTVSAVTFTSAELYDPATNTWSATGSMSWARQLHAATLLPDGRVLISGGTGSDSNPLATAEVYYAGP